uniref:Uncharacterized protein n=1 Tax=Populus trichocarpa TaxID=3694 RepID=A0A3N7F7A2_POPTR
MSGLTEQRNGALAAIVEENPRIFSSSFCRKQSLEPLLYSLVVFCRLFLRLFLEEDVSKLLFAISMDLE